MNTTTIKPGSTIKQVQCEIVRLQEAFFREMLKNDNGSTIDRICRQLNERTAFVDKHMRHRNNARLAEKEGRGRT